MMRKYCFQFPFSVILAVLVLSVPNKMQTVDFADLNKTKCQQEHPISSLRILDSLNLISLPHVTSVTLLKLIPLFLL